MNKKEHKKLLEQLDLERQLRELKANEARSQSLSIGSAGNGCTEISMRSTCGTFLWGIYQPVEVMEFIHQLAANVGCHIAVKPRQDFASWRDWKEEDYMISGNGFPPFANDLALHTDTGAGLPPAEKQPGMGTTTMALEDKDAVATKKAVRRKTTKRTKKTS